MTTSCSISSKSASVSLQDIKPLARHDNTRTLASARTDSFLLQDIKPLARHDNRPPRSRFDLCSLRCKTSSLLPGITTARGEPGVPCTSRCKTSSLLPGMTTWHPSMVDHPIPVLQDIKPLARHDNARSGASTFAQHPRCKTPSLLPGITTAALARHWQHTICGASRESPRKSIGQPGRRIRSPLQKHRIAKDLHR